jgi:hypothetical protein
MRAADQGIILGLINVILGLGLIYAAFVLHHSLWWLIVLLGGVVFGLGLVSVIFVVYCRVTGKLE